MTKWFDTNYHYLVPELGPGPAFRLASDKPFAELAEAQDRGDGVAVKVSCSARSPSCSSARRGRRVRPASLLDRLCRSTPRSSPGWPRAGRDWIQFDEPVLVQDRTRGGARRAVAGPTAASPARRATPSSWSRPPTGTSARPTRRSSACRSMGSGSTSSAAREPRPDRPPRLPRGQDGSSPGSSTAATSGSTTSTQSSPRSKTLDEHRPGGPPDGLDLLLAAARPARRRGWKTRLDPEIALLAGLRRAEADRGRHPDQGRRTAGRRAVAEALAPIARMRERAAASPLRRNPAVRDRLAALPPDADRRATAVRASAPRRRQQRLHLPPLPTTTIGSFPQTGDVRAARRRFEKGEIDRRGVRGLHRGPDPRDRSPSRRSSGSTCWSTASRSATTWSSTSASSSTASPSPATAGCRATARATSARRSSSAMSPGPRR